MKDRLQHNKELVLSELKKARISKKKATTQLNNANKRIERAEKALSLILELETARGMIDE